MRHITEIIVHCTATAQGRAFTVDDVRRWHTLPKNKGGNGWADIGYHYLITLDGAIHPGRPVELAGAHCLGHNARSVGVCYVGGVDTDGRTPKDTRTPDQKNALANLLAELKQRYPAARIHGHRDFAAKACPSFDATEEYAYLSQKPI